MSRSLIVLIVDDNPITRELLSDILADDNYDIVMAGDGLEALHIAAAQMPDLVLLDVMMPELDGFEVCRRMRADPQLAEIPIVMVTALDEPAARLQGIEAGADDFITKPVDRTELRARVRTITRLNRYRRLVSERARFAWVLEKGSEGYVLLSQTDQVVYANPQAQLYLGIGAQTDEPFLELVRRQYRLEPEDAWRVRHVTQLSVTEHPLYLVRPESAQSGAFWLQAQVLPLEADPVAQCLVRLREITTQVLGQRDVQSFHRVIRHKLRTPLATMLGGLQLLVDNAPSMSREDISEIAMLAFQDAKRLHQSVEAILKYVNPPRAELQERGMPVAQLPELVRTVATDLELAPPQVELAAGFETATLVFEPHAVETILSELFENSKKFHPRYSPALTVSAARDNNSLVLAVTDDGTHLSPEQLARVWDVYYQGEKYFTGQVPGVGLGLSLVAVLVWGAGGTCSMENRADGPGVVVKLVLPLF